MDKSTIRAQIMADRKAVTVLKKTIKDITKELALDEETMDKRLDSAIRSEYGATNGLINLISSIASWPVNQGEGSLVSTNRMLLEEKFNLDLVMLADIATYRGHHTFLNDDQQIIEGSAPKYELYETYCEIFLEELKVESFRPTIKADVWERKEANAREKAQLQLEENAEAIKRHKALIDEKL